MVRATSRIASSKDDYSPWSASRNRRRSRSVRSWPHKWLFCFTPADAKESSGHEECDNGYEPDIFFRSHRVMLS